MKAHQRLAAVILDDLPEPDVILTLKEAARIPAGGFYLVGGKRDIIHRAVISGTHVGTVRHI